MLHSCNIKKAQLFDAYLNSGYRQVTNHQNKQEQPTLYEREPSVCLFLWWRILAVFESKEQEQKLNIYV